MYNFFMTKKSEEKVFEFPLMGSIFLLRNKEQSSWLTTYWFTDEGKSSLLHNAFNDSVYLTGSLPISYRVLSHWDDLRLLPKSKTQKGGWRKFSFIEIVWLGVVKSLRNFGYPLEKIESVREHLLRYDAKLKAYPLFEIYVLMSALSGNDCYVMVRPDGVADVGSLADIELSKLLNPISEDMLLISLKSVLTDLGYKVKPAEPLHKLNGTEVELLHHLREEGNDEVSIKLKQGRIFEILATQNIHGRPHLNNIVKEIESNGDFADIVTKFQAGVGETARVTKKYRLKK